MTEALGAALREAAEGDAPPQVALMRVLMEAPDAALARQALDAALEARARAGEATALGRLRAVDALWRTHPGAWDAVRGTIDGLDHARPAGNPDDSLRYWREGFDRLVARRPEASVALYSLGDAALLAEASAEIVALMDGWGLLGAGVDVLDLGCGIGRLSAALSPRVRSVLGLDLSAGMVAAAEARHGALPNVRFARTGGRDLASLATASFDLVLAADVMPYLIEAGGDLFAAHIAGFGRILRPGGHALLLNLSYRGDLAADRRDLAQAATAAGLRVLRAGTRDLRTWDATGFLLAR